MYRYKKDLLDSARFIQPKSGAWAVRKPSNFRLSPYNNNPEDSSTLFKSQKSKLTPHDTLTKRSINTVRNKKRRSSSKSKTGKLVGVIKTVLQEDSREFSDKLKALEPSVKSLSLAQRVPKMTTHTHTHIQSKRIPKLTKIASDSDVSKLQDLEFGLGIIPPVLKGEKLVTVGGYIVSLQSRLEHINGVVKPRVSSDKEGFELEIKITGCHPTEIKFEKRYNTLIIIGVVTGPPRQMPECTHILHGEGKSKWKDLKPKTHLQSLEEKNIYELPEGEHDDITEIINIFVPKNISLSQVYVSRPDAKGRIFVKGP